MLDAVGRALQDKQERHWLQIGKDTGSGGLAALSQVEHPVTTDELLDRVFANFCVGK